MRNEQQSRTTYLAAQPRVIHGCHDRLSGAGRGDQQVAVAPQVTGERQLFQQAFLKRLEPDLDRTQGEHRSRRTARLRRLYEPGAVVYLELRLFPVALEDGGDLVDHRSIACARNAHIPLQATDL